MQRTSLDRAPPLSILGGPQHLAIMKVCAGFLASLTLCLDLVFAAQSSTVRAVSESKYAKAHSLGDYYSFDPLEWQSINVTNLQYKYHGQELPTDDDSPNLESRAQKKGHNAHKPTHRGGLGQVIAGVVSSIWKGLKGLGKYEAVTITW